MRITALLSLLLGVLLLPSAALAAPDNDDRDDAARITRLPASMSGTLVGAGKQDGEDATPCTAPGDSVWFRVDPGHTRRLVARLRAAGDLDATVDVFERVRSRDVFLTCDRSDAHGSAAVAFTGVRGRSYLVRVTRDHGASADAFRLGVVGAGAVQLPGPPLPATGVSATLDRAQRTANAWSMRLRAGVRYRVALTHPGDVCLGGGVYALGARLSSAPVATLGCEGYRLFTPRRSGRYSVVVRASGSTRGTQRYFLQAGRAGSDDSAPGRRVANYGRIASSLGVLDRIDLYRFDVSRRSVLFLHLRTAARNAYDLLLLDAQGHRIACGCDGRGGVALHRGLHRGRFFVAVRNRGRAGGRYVLLRASRTITKSSVSVLTSRVPAGNAQAITLTTTPAVDGPVSVALEQLDPLAGWQYVRTLRGVSRGGVAQLRWTAPTVGHWRVSGRYVGTRGRAPSVTGFAPFVVGTTLRG